MISCKGVNKSFGDKKVLNKSTVSIKKGEIVGLIGPSGSGKSVFIKMLIDFFSPSGGKIKREKEAVIGFSMQNNSLYENLTVKQNIEYFAKLFDVKKEKSAERIKNLIKNLNIEDYEKTLVKNISGGTKKRVDIACSLINNPNVIVLDEPFAGLDPSLIQGMLNFLKELNKQGKTIVISSHRVREIISLSSRIFLVKNKEIKESNKQEIRKMYKKW